MNRMDAIFDRLCEVVSSFNVAFKADQKETVIAFYNDDYSVSVKQNNNKNNNRNRNNPVPEEQPKFKKSRKLECYEY